MTAIFDKSAAYGLVHKKNADRNESRPARFVKNLAKTIPSGSQERQTT